MGGFARSLLLTAVSTIMVAPLVVIPTAHAAAPDVYAYLENPRMTGEGQEPHHAVLRPYSSADQARRGAEETPYTASLDGDWKIHMSDLPEHVPAGFSAPDYDVSSWRTASVPHTWQTDGLDHPMFRNIPEEVWPDDPPKVPRDINPTAAYVRTFDVPTNWQQRRTFLRFEGVTSGYFVWLNGRFLGYDQGGYTPAEFDLTEALRPGSNRLAVQVHRWGAGSYLEDFDQWRYSGIFRSVWLYSTPRTFVRDVAVTTDLDKNFANATLGARLELARKGGVAGKHKVTASLHDPAGLRVAGTEKTVQLTGSSADVALSIPVTKPARWTDETPSLYSLVLTLTAPDGTSHVTSETVGFREITIADRQLKVNGKRVLFKGVNRSETDPDHGRHMPRERQLQDVALMKQLHLNAVRTSHYPSDPHFYDLADRHGLWLADEVDIETHSRENCPSNCLADRPEWSDAFLERFAAMVERDKNHPSVFLWDTGNEAGLGAAHYRMADWAKANEPSRPLYHQSNKPSGDAPFAHVSGPRYPSPERLVQIAADATKPVILGEYAHAMGNSLGNFREFWDTIRATPHLQGGFIWDWAEQNIRQPLRISPDGSGNGIPAHLTGAPAEVDGHRGKALYFSGLDDFVEVYRDRRLDITGTGLTLDAWVKPAKPWTGDFTIVAKGDHQYALKMKNETTLQFYVHSGGWRTVDVQVPADFYGSWHRVTGTYDGTALRMFIDGRQVGSSPFTGTIDRSSFPVNVGRNSETMQDKYAGRMAHGAVDDVRIYDKPLTLDELAADPAADAVLALDFDTVEQRGTMLSYGESISGVDGVVDADRALQPETVQLAWVNQPLRFAATTDGMSVTNERSFTRLDGLELRWKLTEGSRTLREGRQPLSIAAGGKQQVQVPKVANPGDVERWLTAEVVTTRPHGLLPAGFVFATNQFSAGGKVVPGLAEVPAAGTTAVTQSADEVVITGPRFRYVVDRATGGLDSMRVDGVELLHAKGSELDVWRAPNSNETSIWGRPEGEDWRGVGLDRLRASVESTEVTGGGAQPVKVTVRGAAAAEGVANASFGQVLTYTVDNAGTVRLRHEVQPRGRMRELPYLPRIGVRLAVPDTFREFAWYGRGEQESYNDRKDGNPVGAWRSTVDEQYVDYHRPQDNGNHTDTRWALLSDGRAAGLLVSGATDVAVSKYDDLDRAGYPYQLRPNEGWITLHADTVASGVGDTPHPVRPRYQAASNRDYDYQLVLRPLTPTEARSGAPAGF